MFTALSFLSVNILNDGFGIVCNECIVNPDFEEFVNDFESTFICRIDRNRRQVSARIPIDLWNQNENVRSEINCMNNRVEGWKRHVKGLVDCWHSTSTSW